METAIAAKITFAEYMEQALYGPQGYYTSGHAKSGTAGDYFTAPDVGPAFGRLLGLIFQGWQLRFGILPFRVVEAGAGEGALAASLRAAVPFPYTAVERSPVRRKILQARHFEVIESLDELAAHPVSGCLFGNELLDAFPVHRVRMSGGQLQEGYVDDNRWVWSTPSTLQLQAYLNRINVELPKGYETEINLEMADWFKAAAKVLTKGLVLLIDYGRPAHAYYAPERDKGTLRSFRKHRVGDDLLSNPGLTDLTADVDFTSAALDGREAGLTPLAFMELGSFLLAGAESWVLSPELSELSTQHTALRTGMKYLVHPDGMGAAFHVLIFGKNLKLSENDFPHNRLHRLELNK